MSELTARLAIYGAIDRAVVEGTLRVDDVAVHLPPYRPRSDGVASAVGWYADMAGLIGVGPDGSSLDPSDLGAAIVALAELPLDPERPLDAEHRLRALFLAGQLLSDQVDTAADSTFVAAMQAVVDAGRPPDEIGVRDTAARELAQLVVGDVGTLSAAPDGDGDIAPGYVEAAAAARQRDLVSAQTASVAAAVCHEGTAWFEVPGTREVDVAAVITSRVVVAAERCDVPELRARFHPGRWPHCLPTFWGAMEPLAPRSQLPSPSTDPRDSRFVYREHVGDQTHGSQWFSPVLEFWYDDLFAGPPHYRDIDGFAIHYGMARELPGGVIQDPRILVDDGEMAIRRSDVTDDVMTVTATTYKKLAMRPPLPSAGLAIFACASGWADQAKALVTGCLLEP